MAENCPTASDVFQLTGKYRGVGSLGLDTAIPLSARIRSGCEAVASRLVMTRLQSILIANNLWDFFCNVESSINRVWVAMELNGIGFSTDEGHKLRDMIIDNMDMIEKTAHEMVTTKFHMGSPDEIGKVLFVELKLPPPPEAMQVQKTRKTTKVKYTTNKDILSKLQVNEVTTSPADSQWKCVVVFPQIIEIHISTFSVYIRDICCPAEIK